MFHYEKVAHWANHDRNKFILSMIEATSRGSFDQASYDCSVYNQAENVF